MKTNNEACSSPRILFRAEWNSLTHAWFFTGNVVGTHNYKESDRICGRGSIPDDKCVRKKGDGSFPPRTEYEMTIKTFLPRDASPPPRGKRSEFARAWNWNLHTRSNAQSFSPFSLLPLCLPHLLSLLVAVIGEFFMTFSMDFLERFRAVSY